MKTSPRWAANNATRTLAIWIGNVLLLGAIGWFDYITGYDIHVFAFYFLPVWFLGWYVGFGAGLTMTFLAAGTWFAADYLSGHLYPNPAIGYWNGAMEFFACLIVALTSYFARQQLLKQQRLNAELSEATTKIKKLEGMLHICSYCKRIRNEHDEWEQMEAYMSTRSETTFSHGYCPECAQRFFAEHLT